MEILLVNKNRRNDNNNKKGEIYLKWNYKVDRSNSINNMTRNHTHTHIQYIVVDIVFFLTECEGTCAPVSGLTE